jgi:predicted ATP-dependent protease
VTGELRPTGELAAVPGINERVEGFFDLCTARGVSGAAVVIPKVSAANLMLREDVVEAAGAGKFAIYAAATIDEGLEILTGLKTGARGADGLYPAGSLHRLVDDRLKDFANRVAAFFGSRGRSRS